MIQFFLRMVSFNDNFPHCVSMNFKDTFFLFYNEHFMAKQKCRVSITESYIALKKILKVEILERGFKDTLPLSSVSVLRAVKY